MAMSTQKVIGLTLSLIIMSMLLPRGILYLIGAEYVNVTVGGTVVLWSDLDPIINTMFVTILPLIIVIGIMMYYVPKGKNK